MKTSLTRKSKAAIVIAPLSLLGLAACLPALRPVPQAAADTHSARITSPTVTTEPPVGRKFTGTSPPLDATLGDTWVNPKDGAELVYVPAGPFKMGEADNPNNPLRTVQLDAFWVYKNLVTGTQYAKYCQATGSRIGYPGPCTEAHITRTLSDYTTDNYPIGLISWKNATAYARWAGGSLPTEAEWEKAARGTDARLYPWGNTFDKRNLYQGDPKAYHPHSTTTVGNFPRGASWCGALDMVGNSLQWCADWYDEKYPKRAPKTNPTGQAFGKERVVRGHQWWIGMRSIGDSWAPDELRCFSRWGYEPGTSDGWEVGFRCVLRFPHSSNPKR